MSPEESLWLKGKGGLRPKDFYNQNKGEDNENKILKLAE